MIPVTEQFYKHLQSEIHRLQNEYTQTLERLKIAREQGDLSENGAYRYAKMELGNLSRQLRDLRFIIRDAKVQEKTQTAHITFGSIVELASNGKTLVYTLVSQYESNPSQHKISLESPLGSALLHKKVDDIISVQAPSGTLQYQVKKIS